jgi:hypothetical protein
MPAVAAAPKRRLVSETVCGAPEISVSTPLMVA